MPRKVFISYSHQDHVCAQGIARFLIRQGYDVWIDVDKLTAGQNWASNIEDALKNSDVFLALLSKNSVRRSEVLKEIASALQRHEQEPEFSVLFVVIGAVHPAWFSNADSETSQAVIRYLKTMQFVQLDARGSIRISNMQELLQALHGQPHYAGSYNFELIKDDYIYEAGIPEKVYDNNAENFFYRVHVSDLASSTAFPFALDNQWLPDEIMQKDSPLRGQFLTYGYRSPDVQEYLNGFQNRNLFLALIHSRQIILNRASILNSQSLQKFYFSESGLPAAEKDAFRKLIRNGSIIIFLYGNNELTPYIEHRPSYSTVLHAVEEWNALCSEIPMYCIRENWEVPVDKHSEEFVKQCTTLAFNTESNDMLAECFGFDSLQKKEFLAVMKEIEMTVFLQTHIIGTGHRTEVKGYSRSSFYKNFVVAEKSLEHSDPILDCILDPQKPFSQELKKLIDVFYNSMFTRFFQCSAMIPDIRPEDTYIYQLYLPHGGKEVDPGELEYAFSEFFKNKDILLLIQELGDDFYLENWTLERICRYRNTLRWREYVELLEYITNRSSCWEVDFNEVENLLTLLVQSIREIRTTDACTEKNAFLPAYTFRVRIGSKVLDVIYSAKVRKLKAYPGTFFPQKQNSLSLQFFVGDTTSRKYCVEHSIFSPVCIFDGKTNYMGGNAYFEELCGFLVEQCGFMWLY